MHLERNHTVGQAEAIRRIDTFLDGILRRDPPAGIAITDVARNWSENVMNFSFKAKKSFFGATISGVVRVNDTSVVMDADLPGLVTTFVPEDQIRGTINKQLDELLKP